MHLTKNFTLSEATRSDTAQQRRISNQPSAADLETLIATALMMERVRVLLGDQAIHVSSWYRSPELNKAVGGVPNSAHRLGHAVDFTCPGFGSVTDVCRAIADSGLQFDQLIWEYGRWVHISFDPRNRGEVLHIKQAGQYRQGLPS